MEYILDPNLINYPIRNKLDKDIFSCTMYSLKNQNTSLGVHISVFGNPCYSLTVKLTPTAGNVNILNELKCFEITSTRSENVQKLCNFVLITTATNVEAERAFLAAGLSISKLKTNLCENTIDSFMFLEESFENKN